MPQKLDIKKILKKNPQVSTAPLEEASKLAQEVRKLGLIRRGYRLASPSTRGRIHTTDEADSDPRTIKLHR